MAKKKVHDLAKEFNVSGAALVQMLRGMGILAVSYTHLDVYKRQGVG
ncbi:translation initiation factor IF-2 N-terminal domain-containing protein, partial [Treponema sp. R8-4-B8]